MFIEVNKAKKKTKKSDDDSVVKNPVTRKPVKDDVWEVVVESIRIDQIKSYRPYSKDMNHEAYIDGDMTIIYLIGNKERVRSAEILIAESYESFRDRLPTVKAHDVVEAV